MSYKTTCGACDTPIRKKHKDGYRKLDSYNEIKVELNNGTSMTVGVCGKHKNSSKIDLDTITKKAHMGWLEEIEMGIGNKEWVSTYGLKLKATKVI